MITLRNVSKHYQTGEVETGVLRDCSLHIDAGELVVVLGVSGSGKTTLLNLIGGLDVATRGEVWVDNQNLGALSRRGLTEFRRRTVGFVFQFYNLLPTLTACENVEAAVELLGVRGREVRRRALQHLAAVGLTLKADKFPAQLSGGEQQRVAIARALAKEPKLLLADEPTGNLDATAAAEIMDHLQSLQRRTGMTLLIVTHNPRLAEIASRVIEIEDGTTLERPPRRIGAIH